MVCQSVAGVLPSDAGASAGSRAALPEKRLGLLVGPYVDGTATGEYRVQGDGSFDDPGRPAGTAGTVAVCLMVLRAHGSFRTSGSLGTSPIPAPSMPRNMSGRGSRAAASVDSDCGSARMESVAVGVFPVTDASPSTAGTCEVTMEVVASGPCTWKFVVGTAGVVGRISPRPPLLDCAPAEGHRALR